MSIGAEELFTTGDGIMVERSRVGGHNIYYGRWMFPEPFPGGELKTYMTEQVTSAEDAVFRARDLREGQRARAYEEALRHGPPSKE